MEELIFSKINDKIKFCNSKNKITHTDFFTEPEIIKIEKYLQQRDIHPHIPIQFPELFKKLRTTVLCPQEQERALPIGRLSMVQDTRPRPFRIPSGSNPVHRRRKSV